MAENPQKVYCEDCKWFRPAEGWLGSARTTFATCEQPTVTEVAGASAQSFVTRAPVRAYCDVVRKLGPCGATGVFFERAQPTVAPSVPDVTDLVIDSPQPPLV